MNPKHKTPNNITVPLPHWPGLIQALPVNNIATTMPNAEGLKICLPFIRIIYFDAMEIKAASAAIQVICF